VKRDEGEDGNYQSFFIRVQPIVGSGRVDL